MNNLIIYYFSGTGNARHVAEWISQVADKYQIGTRLYDISRLRNRKKIDVQDHCMNRCPQRAVETAHGYIAGLLFAVNSFVLYYFYRFIDIKTYLSGIVTPFLSWFIILLINSVIILFCLFLSYRILHFLMRFRIFERLVVYS